MAKVEIKQSKDMDELLGKLAIDMRNSALRKATSAGGRVVRNEYKKRVPVGDKRHKPELPALKSSIDMKVISYAGATRFVAVVGAKWPDGAHSHLVEDGHNVRLKGPGAWTGQRVPGKRALAESVDTTHREQSEAITKSLLKDIKKAGG